MEHKKYLIAAVDQKMGLGKNRTMCWHLPKEMRYFHNTTRRTEDISKQNMVIMGRTTWESIPENFRPLANRKNVVLSRNPDFDVEGATVVKGLEEAYGLADDSIETVFIIGGASVYQQAMDRNDINGVYLTQIEQTYDCDTFFPEIPERFKPELIGQDEESGVTFKYFLYN